MLWSWSVNTSDVPDDYFDNEIDISQATVQPVLRYSEREKRTPELYGERAKISDGVKQRSQQQHSIITIPTDGTQVGSKWYLKVMIRVYG